MISLTRRFPLAVGVMTAAVTTLAAAAAVFAFEHELERKEANRLKDYVAERAQNEDRRISTLTSVPKAASGALSKRMKGLAPERGAVLCEQKSPLLADGRRRGRPEAFDGLYTADGDYLFGI